MAGSSSLGIQSTGTNDAQLLVDEEDDQDRSLEQTAAQRSQMLAQRDTMAHAQSRAHYSVNGDSSSNPANDGRGLMRASDLAALAHKPASSDQTLGATGDANKTQDKDLAKKEKIKAQLEKELAAAKGGAERSQSVYEYPFIVQIHTDAKGKSRVVSTQYIGPASDKHELMGKKGDAERRALGAVHGGGDSKDKIKTLQNEISSINKSIETGAPLDPSDYPDASDSSDDQSSASTGGAVGAASAGAGVGASVGGGDFGGGGIDG